MLKRSIAWLVLMTVPALFCGAAEKIVIAHRGASGYLPEHTLPAYAMAYGMGAHYIEPDLVMTRDKRFICLHDIHLEGVTNVAEVFPDRKREDGRWYAADFDLAEIKQLRVLERLPFRFPRDNARFEAPTFEEMIELVQGLNVSTKRNVGIYPELKQPAWHRKEGFEMEESFLEILGRYGYQGKDALVYVQCFEREPLIRMRTEFKSELPHIFLMGGSPGGEPPVNPESLAAIAAFADGIGPDKRLVDAFPQIVKQAHEQGLKVHPYTFRNELVPQPYTSPQQELEQFFFEYDVDGLFTDFTDTAVAVLKRRGQAGE